MGKTYTGDSIVDYLKSQGQDSSFSARKELAKSYGITNYTGSGTQNTQLLNTLRSGSTPSTNTNAVAKNEDVKGEVLGEEVAVVNPDTSDKAGKKEDEKKDPLPGVSQELYDKALNTPFETSADTDVALNDGRYALNNLEALTKEDIISQDVKDKLNSQFVVPSAVTEADAYLADQLQKIQSGKTSYTDKMNSIMNQIMNREKFSYDVDTDPLFQQALAASMNSGKQAMQDTIGQASALTGGYGSTYATSAGNQAYNAFIEDAYNNLPQYYNMALQAYQAEGDDMYRQYSMLSAEDEKEFNRNITAYDATYAHRNQVYNEAYNQYRDSINDAYNMANLQISEHGQKVSDAYNYYSATSDYANTLYEREYTAWADSVNTALKEMELANTNYWSQTNFDESVRQFDTTQQANWEQFYISAAQNQKMHEDNLAEEKRQFDETMAFNASKASSSGGGGGGGGRSGGGGSSSGGGKSLTSTDINGARDAYMKAGGGDAGIAAAESYLSAVGKGNMSNEAVNYLLDSLANTEIPINMQNWTIEKDTTNWFGGTDNNDVYTNGTTSMTLKEIKNVIADSGLSKSEQTSFIDKLKKQSKK